MSGVQIEIRLDDVVAKDAFAALTARAQDLFPLMDAIGTTLMGSAKDRISDTNESPDGVPWPKSFRVLADQGGKTLHDSGGLHDSIVSEASTHEVRIGSNLIYAAIHQMGGVIKPVSAPALQFRLADGTVVNAMSVTIPARPYLGISGEDKVEIESHVQIFLEEAFA